VQLTREDRILFLRGMLSSFAQVRVEGSEFFPLKGGVILCCNHTDLSDGLIQLLYTPRPLVFLAKSELFDVVGGLRFEDLFSRNGLLSQVPKDIITDAMNLAGQFIKDLDAMPIIRAYRGSSHKESVKYYSDLAEKITYRLFRGEAVAMYPEGGRSRKGLLPFRGFAARVALRAGVPIVPCAVRGNTGLTTPRALKLPMTQAVPRSVIYRIGEPIPPSEFPDGREKLAIKRLTATIRGRVKELLVHPSTS